MAICKSAKGMNSEEYFHGDDWHVTFEAARDRAEKMRDLKDPQFGEADRQAEEDGL